MMKVLMGRPLLLIAFLGIEVFYNCQTVVSAQECDANGVCDQHERCPVWRDEGECVENRDYMLKHCPISCSGKKATVADPAVIPQAESGLGGDDPFCKDRHHRCHVWANLGECDKNPDMHQYCPKSCGKCGLARKLAVGEGQASAAAADPAEDATVSIDPLGNQQPQQTGVQAAADDSCQDTHEKCASWAAAGECNANPRWMQTNCAKSCNSCQQLGSTMMVYDDDLMAKSAEFGVLQTAEGTQKMDTIQRVNATVAYMQGEQVMTLPDDIRLNCQNRHELCTFWSVIGECENNQAYMATNCAPACMSCHLIDFDLRCPTLKDQEPALIPGALNKMFERIVATAPGNRTLTEEEKKELLDSGMTPYSVVVHSRPSDSPATEISPMMDKSLPPWVITLEDFLTPEECETLIQLGYKYEYKRSEDVGERKFDGSHDSVKSSRRTSENAWCSTFHGCRAEEVPKRIHDRMAKVMGIPAENSEDLQLLKYEKGQFYRTHHDYIPHQAERQCGPRILTFFLYLTDVEEGGGTNFPQLDITVMPKRGRALLWPSVLDSDPMKKDGRMYHQALDVVAGTKFAANGWIHLYDYETPQSKGCN